MRKLILFVITSTAAFSQGQQKAAPAPVRQSIDLATAKRMVAAAEAAALKMDAKVGIAVVDANGDLVFSERIDGASARGVTSAQGKARAALMFGMPTKKVQDLIAAGEAVPAKITSPPQGANEFAIQQGGLPIIKDGKVIGGIGAGGAASADDERFAQAGIDAVFPK